MVVKGYCFASLKAKTTYMFHVMLKTGGEIVGGACTCIVGRGQACSHIHSVVTVLSSTAYQILRSYKRIFVVLA